jgi:hypothetical protein
VKGTGVALLLAMKVSKALNKERVVRLTERHAATLGVIVGVRSVADLHEFRALDPNLRTLGFVEDVASIRLALTPIWLSVRDEYRDVDVHVPAPLVIIDRGVKVRVALLSRGPDLAHRARAAARRAGGR